VTTYVLAGSYREFVIWCADRNLSPLNRDVIYLADVVDVRGRRILPDDQIVRCGTYRYDREIEDALLIATVQSARAEPSRWHKP
jgi:hypothetical protein